MRAAGLEPVEPYPGSQVPWRSTCTQCGQEVAPHYSSVQQGGGCRYCADQVRGAKRRLDVDQVLEVMRAAGVEPVEDYPGAEKSWRCTCTTCGRSVSPTYSNIKRGQRGCAYCDGVAIDPVDATAVMLAAGALPYGTYPGASRVWWSTCIRCQRVLPLRFGTVAKSPRPVACPYCDGRKIDGAEALRAMHAAGLWPVEPWPGSSSDPWPSRCGNCYREVTPTFGNVRKGTGCRYRARYGFHNGTEASIVYLIGHDELRAVKVGVTRADAREERLTRHERHGWRLVRAWTVGTSDLALEVERAVLTAWRSNGVPEGCTPGDMPQGGHTETAHAHLVDIAEIEHIVRSVAVI